MSSLAVLCCIFKLDPATEMSSSQLYGPSDQKHLLLLSVCRHWKNAAPLQGLEDAAHFMTGMNAAHNLTSWVTFGGSYPGSLSAWARLRFPHLVAGSVSSSGPLFAKLDFFEYLQVCRHSHKSLISTWTQVVADALDTTGPGCNAALTEALTTVEQMVMVEAEWEQLETKFKLCQPLADHHDQVGAHETMQVY